MVDFLHLECVRGASVETIGRAVSDHVVATGLVPVETSAERTITLAVHGEWVIVDDRRAPDFFPESWARVLSDAPGRIGVSMRSWSESGGLSLARFDQGRETGVLSYDEPPRARVNLAFLADLAPARARAKLRAGFDIARLSSDDALTRIARASGLPPPTARDQTLEAVLTLEFAEPFPRARSKHATGPDLPAVRPIGGASVHITHSYHVAGITRAELVQAIRQVLARKNIEPRKQGSGRPLDCEIVIVRRGAWHSMGEILHGERADHDRRILWGGQLASRLGEPILAVVTDRRATHMTAWVGGKEGRCLRLRDGVAEGAIDTTCLGGPARVELGSAAASYHALAARKIAEALQLSDPFITGRGLEGIVIAFDRS